MALKNTDPSFSFSGNLVTPDEIDVYDSYPIVFPSVSITWFGTAVGTSLQSPTYGIINKRADYPRSLAMSIVGSSGSTVGGTVAVTGKDQFGAVQTESLGFARAANGGTAVGTRVFAEISAVTSSLATCNAGPATVSVGVGTGGTTALFGLPSKIAATADVKWYAWGSAGAGQNTGTASMWASTADYANGVMAVTDIVAASGAVVVYKTSKVNDGIAPAANL